MLFAGLLYPQPQHSTLLQKPYADLGIVPRITNDGVYAIASFDVSDKTIYLRDFDFPTMVVVKGDAVSRQETELPTLLDLVAGFSREAFRGTLQKVTLDGQDEVVKLKKSFSGNTSTLFVDRGGIMTNSAGEKISVTVESRDDLSVRLDLAAVQINIRMKFPSDLAYADLIGIDAKGNIFLLVERYVSEIPLNVRRDVYTVSPGGKILSILTVPMVKYCTTIREFQIDAEGNLYHLLTTKDEVSIIRWNGLTEYNTDTITYPKEFSYTQHYNDFLPTSEVKSESPAMPLVAADRQIALRLGEEYVLHKYSCAAKNLAPINVRASDGDTVRTPLWLIVGTNARVAYKWGGFNTITGFDNGLASGKFAGDIHTKGVSSTAVGVDCSGFVSRCWQMTYHSSTANMPSITTQYATWDDLKPGDAIHKVGHVRLFVEKTANGGLRVVESSGRDWGVSYWTYTPSDLNDVYTPRYYNGMVAEYSTRLPELLSVASVSDSTVEISWRCDTTQVVGYRLYRSSGGTLWSLLLNESVLRDTFAVVTMTNGSSSFRVASVLRGTSATESNWSNALSVGTFVNTKKILIVDGFEKDNGSWRGPGHVFVTRYGNAIAKRNTAFESIKNSQLTNPRFSLSNYDAVYWMLGDESTEHETFSETEQSLVQQYLESGGKLFVSGSEIGWDLVEKGSAADKNFYTTYLKASYKYDDAGVLVVKGVDGDIFKGCEFAIGQTYEEDYPDEIDTVGGSTLCARYSNQKGAGIRYKGRFGSFAIEGKIIYLAFPLESTASDSSFNLVIDGSLEYFDPVSTVERSNDVVAENFLLLQNYPNPFNPSTTIRFIIPVRSAVTLEVFTVLGQNIETLKRGIFDAGSYDISWNAHIPSGLYFYRITATATDNPNRKFTETKKMLLLK